MLAATLLIDIPAGQAVDQEEIPSCLALYQTLDLGGKIDYSVFERALAGYDMIGDRKKNIITIIDFSKPSTQERLFVIDTEKKKILFHTHVAHGRNSGENFATSFSNESGSHKSSLGFYLTGGTYQGRNGYSMQLYGLEKGINDKALERAIVVHAAAYANPSVLAHSSRLGRSFGCPALPQAVNDDIINTIKDGSVMYIHADDKKYLAQSGFASHLSPHQRPDKTI